MPTNITPAKFLDRLMDVHRKHASGLSDSRRWTNQDLKRLYIIDSTTITLFKEILKGVKRNLKEGKKKWEKAHTVIKTGENVSSLIRFSATAPHDYTLLGEVDLPEGSFITFYKGYVDYARYKEFSEFEILYVTRLKTIAANTARKESDIPDDADSGVVKDEVFELKYGKNKEKTYKARRVAYWDNENRCLFEFLTNNMEFPVETIALIFKKR